jgi:hypothetical protein
MLMKTGLSDTAEPSSLPMSFDPIRQSKFVRQSFAGRALRSPAWFAV